MVDQAYHDSIQDDPHLRRHLVRHERSSGPAIVASRCDAGWGGCGSVRWGCRAAAMRRQLRAFKRLAGDRGLRAADRGAVAAGFRLEYAADARHLPERRSVVAGGLRGSLSRRCRPLRQFEEGVDPPQLRMRLRRRSALGGFSECPCGPAGSAACCDDGSARRLRQVRRLCHRKRSRKPFNRSRLSLHRDNRRPARSRASGSRAGWKSSSKRLIRGSSLDRMSARLRESHRHIML